MGDAVWQRMCKKRSQDDSSRFGQTCSHRTTCDEKETIGVLSWGRGAENRSEGIGVDHGAKAYTSTELYLCAKGGSSLLL